MTKKLTGNHIRQDFIDFFVERGHTAVPSMSLVPGGDSTLLCAEPSPGSRSRANFSTSNSAIPSGMGEIVSGRGAPISPCPAATSTPK